MAGKKTLTYLQLYPDDLLAQIYRNGEEADVTGARVRLWCVAAGQSPVGTLPDDDDRLAAWAGVTPSRWAQIREQIVAGWGVQMHRKTGAKRLSIRRIREQHKRASEIAEKRTEAAKARWGKAATHDGTSRSGKRKVDASADANACAHAMQTGMQKQCLLTPTPSPTPSPDQEKYEEKKKNSRSSGDDRAFAEVWLKTSHHGRTKGQGLELWPGFLRFWSAYPRKVGKLKAWEAWLKLSPPLESALSAVEASKRNGWAEKRFIPHPATWLNGGRWDDEIEVEKPSAMAALDEVERRFRGDS